jgi:hypothetical protein
MGSNKVDIHKKELIEALNGCKGIVSTACKSVGLSRTTYYDYYNEDPEFAKLADEAQENAIDFVEGKLFEKINGISVIRYSAKGEEEIYEQPPSDTAIIFYLKTKGKKRGYVERQEIDHTTKGESFNIKDLLKFDE